MIGALPGKVLYAAGSSGTVSVCAGAIILEIIAHASAGGATVAIDGGDAMPVVNGAPPTTISAKDDYWVCRTSIVFTGTDSFFVLYKKPGAQ